MDLAPMSSLIAELMGGVPERFLGLAVGPYGPNGVVSLDSVPGGVARRSGSLCCARFLVPFGYAQRSVNLLCLLVFGYKVSQLACSSNAYQWVC